MSEISTGDKGDLSDLGGPVWHDAAVQVGGRRNPSPAPLRPCRLLVVDPHPVVRNGVRMLASRSGGAVELVGEAGSAHRAVDAVRQLRPDLVLLGLRLPDMAAPEAVELLRRAVPTLRILLFADHVGEAVLPAALAAGVQGCVCKDVEEPQLLDAVLRVSQGVRVVDHRLSADPAGGRPKHSAAGLTRREYEVVRHVARGARNAEIASALGLTPNTVKTYLQSALQKLGARNRVEAIARAGEAGLL
ncbi:MAG: LuxR C-terminal-related transcriptional regulator [Acidimicrobiia bacterium]